MIVTTRQLLLMLCLILIIIPAIFYYSNKRQTCMSELNFKNKSNLTSLFHIGMKYQTDKVYTHHYETIYEKYLSRCRDSSIRLLEIGLGCGMERGVGASAKTWREYFGSKAIIHFIEFDEKCGKNWESTEGKQLNITMHYGSQDDVKFLKQFMSNMQLFDIIIDDGGHMMNQQNASLLTLVPLVRPGGFYVIEDLETSYISAYGGNYLSPTTTISLIKTFVDEVQAESPKKTIPITNKIFSFEVSDGICVFTIK